MRIYPIVEISIHGFSFLGVQLLILVLDFLWFLLTHVGVFPTLTGSYFPCLKVVSNVQILLWVEDCEAVLPNLLYRGFLFPLVKGTNTVFVFSRFYQLEI